MEKTDAELLEEIKNLQNKIPKAGTERDLGNGYKVVYAEKEPGVLSCVMKKVEED